MSDGGGIEESVKQGVAERVKDKLPSIVQAIESQTGKKLSQDILERLLAPSMTAVATEVSMQATVEYSGPMPSPQVMRGYAEIYPGAPEQLFAQFKAEQEHRHNWENNALEATKSERKRKDCLAALSGVLGIGFSCFLAYLGAHVASAVVVVLLVLGGGAIMLGRQFLAHHGEDGTHVQVNSPEEEVQSTQRERRSQRHRNTSKKS